MKRVISTAVLMVLGLTADADAQVRVKGYTRKDGTYVPPHYRSRPDGNPNNNWSTQGNVNPYTGVEGTKPPAPQRSLWPARPADYLPASPPPSAVNVAGEPRVPGKENEPKPAISTRAEAVSSSASSGAEPPPLKAAFLERPSELSSKKGWQITWVAPINSIEEEIRLAGASSVACGRDYHSPCRPVTELYPVQEKESVSDRGVFYGAVNRVSEKLEVWGFPTIQDCESSRSFTEEILSKDYMKPSGCAVVKLVALEPQPRPIDPFATAERPSERDAVLRSVFKHACYTGSSMAQVELPKLPQEDELLLARGFASCDGRLLNNPAVIEEANLLSFACSYAVGAMFARYGLTREVLDERGSARFSTRAVESIRLCLRELARQKLPGAQSELDQLERQLARSGTSRRRR